MQHTVGVAVRWRAGRGDQAGLLRARRNPDAWARVMGAAGVGQIVRSPGWGRAGHA